jgi:GNAT superfamily N-acetyltransferase
VNGYKYSKSDNGTSQSFSVSSVKICVICGQKKRDSYKNTKKGEKMIRKISSCFSLIYRGQFFLLIQEIVTKLIPSRIFRLKKTVFYHLKRKEQPPLRLADEMDVKMDVVPATEILVREIVRDLYDDNAETLSFYEEFYRKGIEAWVARFNDHIVGVIWLYTGSYLANWEGYDAWLLQIEIEPAAKFVANVFVQPQFRGQGLFSMIAGRCTEFYSENEFYSCIDESNVASIRSHEKFGFQRCAAAYYVRFFQRTYCIFRPNKGKYRFLKLPRGVALDVSLIKK